MLVKCFVVVGFCKHNKPKIMLENALEKFSDQIFFCLSGVAKSSNSLLVKKHTENLPINGDFSFPNTLKSWHGIAFSDQNPGDCDVTLMKCIGKDVDDLISESKKFILPINRTKEDKGRIHMFLERRIAIRVGLTEALKNYDFVTQKILQETSLVNIDPLCEEIDSLTFLRLRCLSDTIKNLYVLTQCCNGGSSNIIVTSKSSSKISDRKVVLCGAVLNAKTGVKETKLSASDFVRIRQDEMTLIAQHKYGVRVSTDAKWKDFIAHLGESAVIFELLQTKPSSAVKITFDHSSSGSSKGASFILYNCARLETIIRTYNGKVEEGTYPLLPRLEDVELTLLSQDDEWDLIFNYIMGFPTLLSNCVEINEKNCEFRPHQICIFLSAMVRVFSQYYRRTRILTEPRKHMLPVIFARMHMLKILNGTLKNCLRILNIKSVSQM